MELQSFLQPIIENLHNSANVKTIYGEPVDVAGKTIIPVAKVAYGFGGGSCPGKSAGAGEQGAGGGGGVSAMPVGALEITREGTRLIHFGIERKLLGAALAGLLIGIFIGGRRHKTA